MTFDTETMAELHASQGRTREALAIYRRLVAGAADDPTRARRQRRIHELEEARALPAAPRPAEAPQPKEPLLGLSRQGHQVRIEWAVTEGEGASEIELLLITRTSEGVVTRQHAIALQASRGSQLLDAAGLHSARAALGRRIDGTFVPSLRASLAG